MNEQFGTNLGHKSSGKIDKTVGYSKLYNTWNGQYSDGFVRDMNPQLVKLDKCGFKMGYDSLTHGNTGMPGRDHFAYNSAYPCFSQQNGCSTFVQRPCDGFVKQ